MNSPSRASRPPAPARLVTPPAIALLAFLLAFLLPGCSPRDTKTVAESLAVTVSIPPQADFVRRIAGDRLTVHTFVANGQDPHHFSATPKQVIQLAGSKIYFTAGMPFEEPLIDKLEGTIPNLEFVDTSHGIEPAGSGIPEHAPETAHADDDHADDDHEDGHGEHADRETDEDHHEKGGHGEEGEDEHAEHAEHDDHDDDGEHHHEHGGDLHYWLSPPLIKIQAHNIHDALVRADSANAAEYAKNLAAFEDELDALHARLQDLLSPCEGRTFYVYHPAFSHFAEAYGLQEKAIETGGKSPTPKQLMRLIEEAREDGAKVIFVQPQFDPASARTVADAINGAVVSIDPLAEDVLANLETIARTIHQALAENPEHG